MNKIMKSLAFTAIAAVAFNVASAQTTVNSETGVGFVAKGDVQTAFGWNNAAFQTNQAGVTFKLEVNTITEVSWECTNTNNEKVLERERTTTLSVTGLLSHLARVRNQVTGFNLTGFDGAVQNTSSTEGPKLNQCPGDPSQGQGQDVWTLTMPAGEPTVISSTGGLQATFGGLTKTLPAIIL